MASNLIVNFIGNNKLSKTTSVISKNLKDLGRTGDAVGKSLNKALGAVGLGLGLSQLTSLLKEASKAAAEDAVSQKQLALALKNTIGANAETISGAEQFIQKTSMTVGILDDKLRPALAGAVRATGSLAKGQELLNVALDVSAATGKDLGLVTKSIARAQMGQMSGLQRLIPGIKAGTDVMQQLKSSFAGAAQASANADPYQRLQVIFDNIKETIGQALLPYLQEMANYLASPDGQNQIRKTVNEFVKFVKVAGELVATITKNIVLVKALVATIGLVKLAWAGGAKALQVYILWTNRATFATGQLKLAIARTGLGALVVLFGELSVAVATYDKETNRVLQKSYRGRTFESFDQKRADKAEKNRWINLGKFFTQQKTKLIKQQEKLTKDLSATGVKFRDAVGLAFGVTGQDEYTFFNADRVIDKLKRMVDAAKGFKANLERLTKAGAGADVKAELIAMGPAQGNIVAKGLLQSGRLSEYLGLRGQLYNTGTQVGNVAASTTNTYTINLNKASVSAADIIRAIRLYEKNHGSKYFATR